MKKIFIIILVLVSIANINLAQDSGSDLRKKLQIGLKFGTNFSSVFDTKSDNFNADPKFGIITGVFAKFPLGKILGFQPEVLFSQKGYKSSGVLETSHYRYVRTSSYIDAPLFISFKPSRLISLVVGPQYSFLLLERDVFIKGNLTADQKDEFNNPNIRKNIFSLIGGVEINVNHLIFGLRVAWDITHNNGEGTSTNPLYRNMWIQVTVGAKSYK